MRFYSRDTELKILNTIYQQSQDEGRMVVITGRRRIGKTYLSRKFAKDKPHLYLFVAKKAEKLLCQEYVKQIKAVFAIPIIGEITQFKEIFSLLLEIGKKQQFVLIIDEFQEFININSSIYSEIQQLWDEYKYESHIQILFLGSVFSLMHKIFEDSNEALFGRADRMIHLRHFSIQQLYQILSDYQHPELELLFNYYMFTGCTPKYIDTLVTNEAFSISKIIDFILSDHSPFLDEGKNVLIEEFGKEYGTYFSILEMISVGKTSQSEIQSVLQKNVGGHLKRLEEDYFVIKKFRPINAKPNSKLLKYYIRDHFLRFWFRFIYRNRTAIETGNFNYVKKVFERQLSTYSGSILEHFFYELYASSHEYNILGSYWESGNTNEIDLVGINELENKMIIGEIKRNKNRINLNQLKTKARKLVRNYPDYKIEYQALSLEDAKAMLLLQK